jgi:hypothetical protein
MLYHILEMTKLYWVDTNNFTLYGTIGSLENPSRAHL